MSNQGVYVMWLYLPQTMSIPIGRLGTFSLQQGVYVYVGSAQRNLAQRVARHHRLEKKLHWHIDYFRAKADVLGAALFFDHPKSAECQLTQELLKIPGTLYPIPGFGSSDCLCVSHFLYVPLAMPKLGTSTS
jgi:Uri superfamily endonuclease